MFAPALLAVCFLGHCAPGPVRVSVSALAAADAASQTKFFILPANPGVQVTDLQFQEYAMEVARALVARGYEPAKTPDEATVLVMMAWSISAPQSHTQTRMVGSMQQQQVVDGVSPPAAPGLPAQVRSHTEFQPVQTPTVETVTSYVRQVSLKGFDQAAYRQDKRVKELWQMTLTSEGSSNDLRAVFPALVAAGQPYLGKGTPKSVTIDLGENSNEVKYIRGEIPVLPAKK
jgi:hypothetical protein